MVHPWTSVRPSGSTGRVALATSTCSGLVSLKLHTPSFTQLLYSSHFVREFTSQCEHAQFSTLPVWRSYTTVTVLKISPRISLKSDSTKPHHPPCSILSLALQCSTGTSQLELTCSAPRPTLKLVMNPKLRCHSESTNK